jgi:thymidine kinase
VNLNFDKIFLHLKRCKSIKILCRFVSSQSNKNYSFLKAEKYKMFLENTVNHKEQFGWIEVICGSMFSGKTEELIRRLKRAQFAKQKVEIFKPEIDIRYHDEMVVSHDSNQIRSTPVPAAANIAILAQGCDVVGIDEAQFFDDEIVKICNDLANQGIRVIVAGLDMDFKGNPFGPMPALMATAEYVTKVHAVCTKTGNLANYSHRKNNNDKLVMLGETEEYEPLSRAAYFYAMKNDEEYMKTSSGKPNSSQE